MRTYKIITPKVEPREVVDEIKCDLCGAGGGVPHNLDGTNWAALNYDVDATMITRETGDSFPEGGTNTIETFDICGDCFENKLKPWMASQGALPGSKTRER